MTQRAPTVRHRTTVPGALAVVLGAQFVVMVDTSIVNVALSTIQRALGFSAVGVEAVVTAYATAFGGVLILGGRLVDLMGRRRTFVLAMLGFVVTSLACGLAPTPGTLVVARAAQGLTAAVLAPAGLALLTTLCPEGPERHRALSAFASVSVLGMIAGLVAGGLLVDALGWRSVFAVNVPIGLVAVLLAPRVLPSTPRIATRVDVGGAVLITLAIALLVYAPTRGAESGWGSPSFVVPLIGAVVAVGAFLRQEHRTPSPLIRPGLLRTPGLRAANVVLVGSGAMNGIGFLLVALYLQQVLGYSALRAGLAIVPMGAIGIVVGAVGGRLIARVGVRWVATAATLLAAVALASLGAAMSSHGGYLPLLLALVVTGVGFPLVSASSRVASSMGVDDHEQGTAGGLAQTSFQIGLALGVAALLSLAADRTAALGPPTPGTLVAGYRLALAAAAALTVPIAAVAAIGLQPAGSRGAT